MRFGQLLHDPAKRVLAVGIAHGAEMRMQARAEVFQISVVGKDPVAAPQLTHERMAVLQAHHALGGLADVGDNVPALNGVTANEFGHR